MDLAKPNSLPITEGVLELSGDWRLHHGGLLTAARVAWRLTGPPTAPVVCTLGGIWCDRVLFDLNDAQRGCWREIIGPGRVLDANRFRILSFDYLGGRGESTIPQPGMPFPSVSTYDQAEALVRLIDHLGLAYLHAILGGSYGGMVALAFAECHPERVGTLIIVSAADRPHPMAIAWHSIQRHIVKFAGDCGQGEHGVRLARAIGMSLYRSPEEIAARFPGMPVEQGGRFVFPVERYLFADTSETPGLTPEAFLCLSESLDLHRVDASRIFVPITAVGVREDQLVPISDMRALAARLSGASLHEITSIHGHDAYLREAPQLRGVLAEVLGNGP
jgi:homoserine O-acetyltransferase